MGLGCISCQQLYPLESLSVWRRENRQKKRRQSSVVSEERCDASQAMEPYSLTLLFTRMMIISNEVRCL